MFVVVAYSPNHRRPARSNKHTTLEAVEAATEFAARGYKLVTITDLRDGKPRPLDWWRNALAGTRFEQP